jgi:hypothetical protein
MDEQRGYKALPPVLLGAIALTFVAAAVELAWMFVAPSFESSTKWMLTLRGLHTAADLLAIAGCLELADRLAGNARRAVHAAALAIAAGLVMWIVWDWIFVLREHYERTLADKMLHWVDVAIRLAPAVALAIAAWPRRAFAITGLVLGVLPAIANIFQESIFEAFGEGHGYRVFFALSMLMDVASFTVLAIGAARGTTSPDTRRAAAGFLRIGGALRVRVMAALVGSGIGLLVALGSHGGEGSIGIMKLAMIGGLAINIVADVMLVFGAALAARAALPVLPRWPLVAAGACVAWSAGVMLDKLPHVYRLLYGDHSGTDGFEYMAMFGALVPLLELGGIALVAATIGAFANRRDDQELATHASGKGVGFVVLMLAGIAITTWLIPEAKSESGLLVMMLCALTAMLAAMILMARLCKLAAEAVDREPGLPAARVVG